MALLSSKSFNTISITKDNVANAGSFTFSGWLAGVCLPLLGCRRLANSSCQVAVYLVVACVALEEFCLLDYGCLGATALGLALATVNCIMVSGGDIGVSSVFEVHGF